MPLFDRSDPRADELVEEIRKLTREVAELKGERDAGREAVSLARDITRLKKELTDLEIDKDRQEEAHEREKREVEHMVGLQRRRSEMETEAAQRDVKLTVREENLKQDRDRFEKEMEFTRERFEKEVGYLQDLMREVLSRLPTVSVEKSIDLHFPQPVVSGTSDGPND